MAPRPWSKSSAVGASSFFRQPRNVGHVANFNTCLERSRGRLVHLLHGDDCVRDGFYAAMGRLLEAEPTAGAAFCRYIAIDEQGDWSSIAALEQRSAGLIPDWLEKIAVGQRLQTPCMVVRREVYERLGGFDRCAAASPRTGRCGSASPRTTRSRTSRQPLALYRVHTLSR